MATPQLALEFLRQGNICVGGSICRQRKPGDRCEQDDDCKNACTDGSVCE
jgi:hypothetical protein